MIELKCEQQQLYCCDAMLMHEVFILTADCDAKQWRLYSEAKYLALEQKLLAANAQLGVENNTRLARILLGNCIELKRQGAVIPLPDDLIAFAGDMQFRWMPD
ncbi:hypothetical protein [Rheinheimera maricola]|uniref:Uncharacterized protein n=1 Tax=Rheinheimera maricola TaxID=2793282 RepID=A0ABS7XFM3_9GAMM|nr:hypothetical protein [Rheinheimera maricola]MBZ9613527.1 hypothetical protein [Rheinheimera maricola]